MFSTKSFVKMISKALLICLLGLGIQSAHCWWSVGRLSNETKIPLSNIPESKCSLSSKWITSICCLFEGKTNELSQVWAVIGISWIVLARRSYASDTNKTQFTAHHVSFAFLATILEESMSPLDYRIRSRLSLLIRSIGRIPKILQNINLFRIFLIRSKWQILEMQLLW